MKLIIGLGNPGKEYIGSRHNLGWQILDALVDEPLQLNKKFNSEILKTSLAKQPVLVAKPQTYMNNSGSAVVKISRYYKIPTEDIWIVHDDIDLAFGKLRVGQGRSSAGHRGVESIIQSLGTKDFIRFRIGLRPSEKKIDTDRYVMENFSQDEQQALPAIINRIKQAIEYSLNNPLTEVAGKFN